MRSINRSTLEGNLTHDVDLRRLPSGSPVATLRVGFNTSQRTENGWGDRSHYLDVEVFGRQAEECATRLQRSSYVLIDGHIESQNWTDREGNRRHRVFVVADLVRWPSGQPERLREPAQHTEGALPQQMAPQPQTSAPAVPPPSVAQPLTIDDSPAEHQTAPDPASQAPPAPPPVRPLDDHPPAPEPAAPATDPVALGADGAIPITPADLPF